MFVYDCISHLDEIACVATGVKFANNSFRMFHKHTVLSFCGRDYE